jgi:hypothetical protein
MRFIRRYVIAASCVLVFLGSAQAQLVTGACGSSNGADLTSAPTADLCSSGAASTVSGSGPWQWSCFGNGRGTTATCSALKLASAQGVSGACGSSNGGSLTSRPTANLCSAGAASSVNGSGPWNWTCAGSGGGMTVGCSALLEINGACGSANGVAVSTAPTANLCSAGTASTVIGSGPWQWNCAGSNGGATGSCSAPIKTGSSGSSDPTAGLLPSNRDGYVSWSTAGLQSIGGIPNRTTIYETLSPSGGDDTTAINAALSKCPSGQVVLLTAGVFRINGNGLSFTTSNCTLRGAGPGSQKNTGINPINQGDASGSYVVDSTATQLVKADRATNLNYGVLYVGSGGTNNFGASTNLAADAAQGTYSLTLASAPSTPITVGDIVYIDMNTSNDPDVVFGPSFTAAGTYSRGWFTGGRLNRSLNQLMEVTGVSNGGKTITFDTPFHTTFTVANVAQLTQYTVPFSREIGVENLFIFGGEGGDFHGNLAMSNCAYCWVKNVEAAWSVGTNIGFYSTFRSELRDSFIHETPDPNPGGAGYQSGLNVGASDNLFENNIMWYGNKEIVMRASGGGNVVAYNYMDDAFGSAYPESPEAGANAGHFTTPHMELLEGNYSQNFKGDSYWGNSIYITVFRNWLSDLRAAHPPLNTYDFKNGGCDYVYGDYTGRVAVDVQAYSFYQSFVGNVLGMNGQVLLTNPFHSENCYNDIQTEFLTQVTTTAGWNSSSNSNAVVMWQFGDYQASVNTPPCNCWSFIDTTIATELRQGNWDWVTRAQHWYGIGGTTDGSGGSPVTIPNSFYLSSKPAFFGTQTWPWVDPTTGTTYKLPAMYCFQHSAMPTCLQ